MLPEGQREIIAAAAFCTAAVLMAVFASYVPPPENPCRKCVVEEAADRGQNICMATLETQKDLKFNLDRQCLHCRLYPAEDGTANWDAYCSALTKNHLLQLGPNLPKFEITHGDVTAAFLKRLKPGVVCAVEMKNFNGMEYEQVTFTCPCRVEH